MAISFRQVIVAGVSLFLIFAIGFSISSGMLVKASQHLIDAISDKMRPITDYHSFTLAMHARHYFLLPEGGYTFSFYDRPVSLSDTITILSNALFNSLFQPMFLCIFTPQVVLNYLLFPFFLYGVIRFFRDVPLLILIFFGFSVYVALYGSVVEALVRHRLSCELLYLLIGVAGFTDLITSDLF